MYTWIYNLIDHLPGFLKGVFRAVAAFFLAPWRLLGKFFHLARTASNYLWGATEGLRKAITGWASGVGFAIFDIITKIIPNWIRLLGKQLTTWVNKGLNYVWNNAVIAFRNIQRWMEQGFNLLRDFANRIIGWAEARFNAIFEWINNVANKAVDLVLHPDKLVAWILPHLWGPLFRFLDSRAEVIGRWFLSRSIAGVLRSANVIERVIARLL